jgi:hypothetical protein
MRLTHDVGLRSNGYKSVDMFTDRNKNLPGHMTALLSARCLVLDMDTSSTLLDEELCKLHNGSEATMASIGVSDDGPQIVNVR